MENRSEGTAGIQMEQKQNPNHFQVKARKASGAFRASSVCDVKRPGQKEVNGGDDVLGDVLQKTDWKLQKFLGHMIMIL